MSFSLGEFFDSIETVARVIRGNEEPFGGIQLILTGDFLQLPPIKSQVFCFQAKSWSRSVALSLRSSIICYVQSLSVRFTDVFLFNFN